MLQVAVTHWRALHEDWTNSSLGREDQVRCCPPLPCPRVDASLCWLGFGFRVWVQG